MIEFSDWLAKGNGVRRSYRVTSKDSTKPTIFQIHCDLSKGFTGTVDTFVNFLVLPGLVQRETSLQASIAIVDDTSPSGFSALAVPAEDGSTVINVMGRENVGICLKAFSSGSEMKFQLRSNSGQLIF